MATELFKEVMLNLVDDYSELREAFLKKVEAKEVRLEDIDTFNFKEYVDSYLGFITIEADEESDEFDFDDDDDETPEDLEE